MSGAAPNMVLWMSGSSREEPITAASASSAALLVLSRGAGDRCGGGTATCAEEPCGRALGGSGSGDDALLISKDPSYTRRTAQVHGLQVAAVTRLEACTLLCTSLCC